MSTSASIGCRLTAVLLLFFVSAGCDSNSETHVAASALFGTTWTLVAAETSSGTVRADDLRSPFTIRFQSPSENSRFSGRSECNSFSGTYAFPASPRTILFSSIIATEAYCGPENSSVEQMLFTGFGDGGTYFIDGTRLRLNPDDGNGHVLIFEAS